MITLKDGSTTTDPRLDRLVQFDERSRNFPVRALLSAEALRTPRSYTWGLGQWLDQGREGRCVEYSICHEMLAKPVPVDRAKIDAILSVKGIYWPAQQEDEWEGGDYPGADPVYSGTSVLAGIKVATRLGFYEGYDWGFSLHDLVTAVGFRGPAVLGVNWYEGMFDVDEYGWIKVSGDVAGGHAIAMRGVRIVYPAGAPRVWSNVDFQKSYGLLHNSWGRDWGINGVAKISLADLKRLLAEQGECCIPRTRSK